MRIVQYSTLCGERFQGKILQITMGNRLDTVQYSSVRMMLREISEPRAVDAVYRLSAFGQSRLQEHHSYVLEDEMAFRQTSCLYDQYFRSQRWAHFSLPKGHVVSCRFNGAFIVSLSVCRFVMSSVVPYNGGGLKV